LSSEIFIGPAIENVAFGVLELLVGISGELL
jgi:hypothetical protein